MTIALDIIAGWTALDVVLLAGWHLAHVQCRRVGVTLPAGVPLRGHRAERTAPRRERTRTLVAGGPA